MLKNFSFLFLCIVCCFESQCMKAAACISISNSTEESVWLSYEDINMDLPITKKPSPGGDFKILPSHDFVLSETFEDYNRSAVAESDVEFRKIKLSFQENIIGYIYLVCSMYSPDPYYAFEIKKNPFGVLLQRKIERRGGGSLTLEIIKTKSYIE